MKSKITANTNQIERVVLHDVEELEDFKYYPKKEDYKIFFGLYTVKGQDEYFIKNDLFEYSRKELIEFDFYKIVNDIVYLRPRVIVQYISGYKETFYFETYKDAKVFYEEITSKTFFVTLK